MEFDRWTVLLLRRREPGPPLSDATQDELQDRHLAYLTGLHSDGRLVAAGPVEGAGAQGIAGICIYRGGVEEARALAENDPAVQAGRFSCEVFSWSVPGGAMRFAPVRFPRSMKEATED